MATKSNRITEEYSEQSSIGLFSFKRVNRMTLPKGYVYALTDIAPTDNTYYCEYMFNIYHNNTFIGADKIRVNVYSKREDILQLLGEHALENGHDSVSVTGYVPMAHEVYAEYAKVIKSRML